MNQRKTDYSIVRLVIMIALLVGGWVWSLSNMSSRVEAVEDAYADVKDTPKQIAVMSQRLDSHIENFDEYKKESKERDKKMLNLLYDIKSNGNTH